MEVGNLVSSEIHYDRSGRSLGSGSVVFEDRDDAIRAIQQYDGIPLDGELNFTFVSSTVGIEINLRRIWLRSGRPMKIEIASTAALGRLGPRRIGVFRNKNIAGGGGGGGGRRRFGKWEFSSLNLREKFLNLLAFVCRRKSKFWQPKSAKRYQ